MENRILQQLYEGKIYPAENIGSDNPELQKIHGVLADEKAKFMKSLSDSQRENFQRLEDLQDESATIYAYESFVHGSKLGVTLLVEGLSDSENLLPLYLKNKAGDKDGDSS
jgi:hypothetical protein